MSVTPEQITLVLGVDACHLEELRHTWPTWLRYKPEILRMPLLVFFDPDEIGPENGAFLQVHPEVRWVPWRMPGAASHREKMITAWVHVPAREVRTPWYLKLDTDAIATGSEAWLKEEWFHPNHDGETPVFVSAKWSYSKPRHVMDLLDDWGDTVPALRESPRLNLPYDAHSESVRHPRIISWIFFGRTDWTAEVANWLGPDGRMPHPSQDTFLFYCAKRSSRHYVRAAMADFGWLHTRLPKIRQVAAKLGIEPAPRSPTTRPVGKRWAEIQEPRAGRGVIYYNSGTSCAVRLLVSLSSLRLHYSGPVMILSEGEESHRVCRRIAKAMDAELREWDCGVPHGRHRTFLAKTCYHTGTPFSVTVVLDADTLVVGAIGELFDEAETGEFCVASLGAWRSDGRIIGKRIRGWQPWLPEDIEPALRFGPAINCGVVAFREGAAIFDDWLRLALPGRETFIPDEVCCQVILHRYPHRILNTRWNRSCKHDDPSDPDTRIIHFHGRKHCRPGLPFHAGKWLERFEAARTLNLAGIREWFPAGDRMLEEYDRGAQRAEAVVPSGSTNSTGVAAAGRRQ